MQGDDRDGVKDVIGGLKSSSIDSVVNSKRHSKLRIKSICEIAIPSGRIPPCVCEPFLLKACSWGQTFAVNVIVAPDLFQPHLFPSVRNIDTEPLLLRVLLEFETLKVS